MNSDKVRKFMQLAGTTLPASIEEATPQLRALAAQLLLSETLEYVIKGLGVVPIVDGVAITKPDGLHYETSESPANALEMLDGLADVAYTMFWNAEAFSLPLKEAFELVCDNNLEKFVPLDGIEITDSIIEKQNWHCGKDVSWPEEVVQVRCLKVDGSYFAVGIDARGKVRKPSSYKSVDLQPLL